MSERAYTLMITFRMWLIEIPLAGVNAFLLMDHVYAPRVGDLRAHQLAMATRIGWIVVFAIVFVRFVGDVSLPTLAYAGLFWMGLWLGFEWAGSLLIRRPVHEILVGWHVEHGYLWPWVLLAYLLSPLLAGVGMRLARR